jgi:predicted ATPase
MSSKTLFVILALLIIQTLSQKISERVQRDVELKGGMTNILIMLKKQTNFESMQSKLDEMDEIQRGRFVMKTVKSKKTLKKSSKKTQKKLKPKF